MLLLVTWEIIIDTNVAQAYTWVKSCIRHGVVIMKKWEVVMDAS